MAGLLTPYAVPVALGAHTDTPIHGWAYVVYYHNVPRWTPPQPRSPVHMKWGTVDYQDLAKGGALLRKGPGTPTNDEDRWVEQLVEYCLLQTVNGLPLPGHVAS